MYIYDNLIKPNLALDSLDQFRFGLIWFNINKHILFRLVEDCNSQQKFVWKSPFLEHSHLFNISHVAFCGPQLFCFAYQKEVCTTLKTHGTSLLKQWWAVIQSSSWNTRCKAPFSCLKKKRWKWTTITETTYSVKEIFEYMVTVFLSCEIGYQTSSRYFKVFI